MMINNNAAVSLKNNYKLQQVLILLFSLSFLVLYTKLDKLYYLYDTINLNLFIVSLLPDVLFIFLFNIILFVNYKFNLNTTTHLITAIFILLTVAEHTTFMATGSSPNWYMYKYSLYNLFMLKNVLASEVSISTWILLLPSLTLVIISYFITSTKKTNLPSISKDSRNKYIASSALVCFMVFIIYNTNIKTKNITANTILSQNAVLSLSSEILDSTCNFVTDNQKNKITEDKQKDIYNIINTPTTLTKNTSYNGYNLVFIILESARARSLKPYNSEFDTMPFLNELAKKGVVVENAHTVTSHTSKALVPIICGIYPKIDTRITESQLNGIPTKCLPSLLSENGYKTAFFQSADHRFENRKDLLENFGFQHIITKKDVTSPAYHQSSYFGYEDKAMIPHIEKYLAEASQPFFMSILTLTSHHNYGVPKSFKTKNWSNKKNLNNYLNTLSYTDEFLKDLFVLFESQDIQKNTLFVIVGDHGEAFGEHGRMQHDTVIYQEGIEIPMIILGPQIPKNTLITGLRQTIDTFPTALDLLGFDINHNYSPGKNLLTTNGHNKIFSTCWYKNYCMAIRQGDWKVIYHYNRQKPEIFNLSQDPLEITNLAKQKNLPLDINTMLSELQSWEQNTNLLYNTYSMQQNSSITENT